MYDGDFPPSYLATAYSHRDDTWTEEQRLEHRERRFKAAMQATAWLLSKRIWTYSPIVHCHHLAATQKLPTDALFWKEFNEYMIDVFEAVTILCDDRWTTSRGVQMEIEYADSRSYIIHYLVPTHLVSDELKEPYVLLDHQPANVK